MTENFAALTEADLLMLTRNAVAALFAQPGRKQILLGSPEAFEAANAPSA